MHNQQPDLSQTTPICSEEGNQVFQQGFILRKMSKLLAGTAQDVIYPVQIFYDVVTGKPLKDTIPKELWSEFFGDQEETKIISMKDTFHKKL